MNLWNSYFLLFVWCLFLYLASNWIIQYKRQSNTLMCQTRNKFKQYAWEKKCMLLHVLSIVCLCSSWIILLCNHCAIFENFRWRCKLKACQTNASMNYLVASCVVAVSNTSAKPNNVTNIIHRSAISKSNMGLSTSAHKVYRYFRYAVVHWRRKNKILHLWKVSRKANELVNDEKIIYNQLLGVILYPTEQNPLFIRARSFFCAWDGNHS